VYGGLLFLMMRFSPGGMAALVTRIVHRGRGAAK
jgi:branched-chain amino acid transport system permease protein